MPTPTLEQLLTEAIAAQNALTQEVALKMAAINLLVNNKLTEMDTFMATARGEFPLPPNLIANSYMTDVDGTSGAPVGYVADGLTIAAVSAFTKGFEGVYSSSKPGNAAATLEAATGTNPFWFGPYYKGPRLSRGGLADGWAGLSQFSGVGEGHILKITSNPSVVPGNSTPSAFIAAHKRFLSLPSARLAATDRLGFRCYFKLVSGSAVGIGVDSGFYGVPQGEVVTKATIDTGVDGWYFIDRIIPTSQVTVPTSANFLIGFRHDEAVEAYMALPYIYVPAGARPGVVNS